MNCQLLANKFAFDCIPLLTANGEQAFEFGTPFAFADGAAINVYAIPHGDTLELTDNGDTLLHLTGMGMAAWHKSRQTALLQRPQYRSRIVFGKFKGWLK
jgi:hypothetical protein